MVKEEFQKEYACNFTPYKKLRDTVTIGTTKYNVTGYTFKLHCISYWCIRTEEKTQYGREGINQCNMWNRLDEKVHHLFRDSY